MNSQRHDFKEFISDRANPEDVSLAERRETWDTAMIQAETSEICP
jgi:hypothetical protein